MKDKIGVVASGTTFNQMIFYSVDQIETDFVMVEHEQKKTIYRILDIEVVNKRFRDEDFARYVKENDDYSKYNIYVATTIPIAHIDRDNRRYAEYWFIALPGSRVMYATEEDIATAHGISQKDGRQRIGHLRKHKDVSVWINLPYLLTTHMAIIGRSGRGKSNFTKIILKSLQMQYLLFTPTNEYVNVKNGRTIDVDKITIPADPELVKKVLELSGNEVLILNKYFEHNVNYTSVSTKQLADYIIKYFYEHPNELEGKMTRRTNMLDSLCEKLYSSDYFVGTKTNSIPNKSYIFNMQKLSNKEQEVEIYLYLNQLLSQRRDAYKLISEGDEIPNRIVVFLEEAHKYIPSTTSSFCKGVINAIAREGRKLGIHLVLLSQRPRYLDPTTLSQCGSVVTFNLSNPDDIDYIMSNANFYGDEYRKTIRDLKIGECVLESDYLENGITCKVELFHGE